MPDAQDAIDRFGIKRANLAVALPIAIGAALLARQHGRSRRDRLKDQAEDVGSAIKDTAKDVGSGIKDRAEDVYDKVSSIDRFGIKQADFKSLAPTVLLPLAGMALGGRAGSFRGAPYANAGRFIGGASGALGGLALREHALPTPIPGGTRGISPMPTNDPLQLYQPDEIGYAIDDTMENIPHWAYEGARSLKAAGFLDWVLGREKTAEGAADFILGEVPGALPFQQGRQAYKRHGLGHGFAQGGKSFLGMAAGGVPSALLGLGVGKGIERLTGHKGGLNVPGVNLSLSEILAGLGGSIGAVKGSRAFTGMS